MEAVDYVNGKFSFSIGSKANLSNSRSSSGDIREDYGIHRVEGTYWILDQSEREKKNSFISFPNSTSLSLIVNTNQSILPNITVGYQIRDSCWYAPVALEQTIEFIGNSVLTAADLSVSSNGNRARLAAIIGPGDSSITMQTHNILQLFEMPQIGYSSTARQLSDKEKFKYFARVIASDTQQAQAIVDIIRQFNWSYVATIGTEGKNEECLWLERERESPSIDLGDYGRGGVEAIRRLLHNDACIGADLTMVNWKFDLLECVCSSFLSLLVPILPLRLNSSDNLLFGHLVCKS